MSKSSADEDAIARIILLYATAIDSRDWDLFRSLFATDFAGDYGPGKHWRGVDAITAYMSDRHRDLGATLHRITNIVIHCDAGLALARSYVDAVLMPSEQGGTLVEAIGFYDDRLTKSSNTWLIAERKFTLVRLREI